ncbi:MAG: hypothetical protein V1912_07210, partial [bacterium]
MEESASPGSLDPRATAQTPAAPSPETAAQTAAAPSAKAAAQALRDQLQPWHEAVENPAEAQETVLRRLLHDFAKTGYGADHGAAKVAEAPGGDARGGGDRATRAEATIIAEYRR